MLAMCPPPPSTDWEIVIVVAGLAVAWTFILLVGAWLIGLFGWRGIVRWIQDR